MSLVSIFASAILPIVLIAGVGVVLGRARDVEPGPLNTATVYVLAPALVLHSLLDTGLGSGTLLRIAAGVTAFTLAMAGLVELSGRLLGVDDATLSALVLVATFPNAGNYGIPVSDFAFGSVGRGVAVLYVAVQSVLMYTVGVYVASRGGGSAGVGALKRVFRIPLIYAVAGGLLLRAVDLVPASDSTAMETLQLVGDASIPVMLLIMGIQLANTDFGTALPQLTVATVGKMVVAPVVAVGVALLLGFEEPTVARTFVLESAMPAAVTPLVLLIEFADDVEVGGVTAPEFVSTTVAVTTLLSVPLLTLLISLLQSGTLI
ncbi:AEC family transporter [Halolamina sp. CBA1230]|uniref:AEC family transporter n=1 Tax=Halolamina sp. CBA1230 TaxID=1853690 RepID=UPI0009A1AD6E|nr:AEC family transporter [Halolamina sp. CBA1230]QKY21139.1 AEC family transporter [Halolamina sp. CBA1230]